MGLVWTIIYAVIIVIIIRIFMVYWNNRIAGNKLVLLQPFLVGDSLDVLNIHGDTTMFTQKVKEYGYNIENFASTVDGKQQKINRQDNTYDIVTALFVVSKSPDKQQLLQDMIRVTKDKIVIADDVIENETDEFLSKCYKQLNGEYICHYSTKKWLKIFTKMGLVVDKIIDIDTYKFNVLYPISRRMFVLRKVS